MPSSEWKWTMPGVWRTVKRLMHMPLSTTERDELQGHSDGSPHGTNSRSRHRAGHASGSRKRGNKRRHDTEYSDANQICELKAKSAAQEGKIKRLEGKVAEQSQLLQETLAKLTSVEQAAKQQTAQGIQAFGRLEEKVAKLDRDLQEKTAVLHSMVNRGDGRIVNRVQRPEANAAELTQAWVPQDKIAKLSNADGAASRRSKRPALTIEHLETKVVVLDSPLEERTPELLSAEDAAGQRDQKIHDSSATKQKLHHITEGERTNKLLPRAPVGRADSISVAEVAELVRVMNAQLEQTSSLIVDALSYRQSPMSGRVVSNELRDYLGSWLCDDLQRRSNEPDTEPDPLITQIVLQTGLVNACSRIINGWTPPDIGQGVADMRRAPSAKSNNQDINNKYLTRLLLELMNTVGGSLQSGGRLPPEYQEKVEDIAKKAVGLHRIINEEVISLKLATYTIPSGTEFDFSRMEDTEGDGGETGSTPHDTVVCTMEMGLQCRKKVEPGKSRQDYGVTMKAKVVLASTLEP